uniref:Uncharacterized protein n=1 Tax=Megaselia scalaris TaxID=36166 RepID=T1GF35_MEGSC
MENSEEKNEVHTTVRPENDGDKEISESGTQTGSHGTEIQNSEEQIEEHTTVQPENDQDKTIVENVIPMEHQEIGSLDSDDSTTIIPENKLHISSEDHKLESDTNLGSKDSNQIVSEYNENITDDKHTTEYPTNVEGVTTSHDSKVDTGIQHEELSTERPVKTDNNLADDILLTTNQLHSEKPTENFTTVHPDVDEQNKLSEPDDNKMDSEKQFEELTTSNPINEVRKEIIPNESANNKLDNQFEDFTTVHPFETNEIASSEEVTTVHAPEKDNELVENNAIPDSSDLNKEENQEQESTTLSSTFDNKSDSPNDIIVDGNVGVDSSDNIKLDSKKDDVDLLQFIQ